MEKTLTVCEAAAFLRIHRTTLYTMLKNNQIPGFKVGRRWRLDSNSLVAWGLAAQEQGNGIRTKTPLMLEPEERTTSSLEDGHYWRSAEEYGNLPPPKSGWRLSEARRLR